jgi:hypothetical protein
MRVVVFGRNSDVSKNIADASEMLTDVMAKNELRRLIWTKLESVCP